MQHVGCRVETVAHGTQDSPYGCCCQHLLYEPLLKACWVICCCCSLWGAVGHAPGRLALSCATTH